MLAKLNELQPFFEYCSSRGLCAGFTTALARESEPVIGSQWGVVGDDLITLGQPHGNSIYDYAQVLDHEQSANHDTNQNSAPDYEQRKLADAALAGFEQNALIVIRTADCVPVLICDDNSYAAAHAGWRGCASSIVVNLLQRLGTNLNQTRLALGPSIKPCCYAVEEQRLQNFESQHIEHAYTAKGDHIMLDLSRVILNQAILCGIRRENIFIAPHCTQCYGTPQQPYSSFRREPELPRQNLSFIGHPATAANPSV